MLILPVTRRSSKLRIHWIIYMNWIRNVSNRNELNCPEQNRNKWDYDIKNFFFFCINHEDDHVSRACNMTGIQIFTDNKGLKMVGPTLNVYERWIWFTERKILQHSWLTMLRSGLQWKQLTSTVDSSRIRRRKPVVFEFFRLLWFVIKTKSIESSKNREFHHFRYPTPFTIFCLHGVRGVSPLRILPIYVWFSDIVMEFNIT